MPEGNVILTPTFSVKDKTSDKYKVTFLHDSDRDFSCVDNSYNQLDDEGIEVDANSTYSFTANNDEESGFYLLVTVNGEIYFSQYIEGNDEEGIYSKFLSVPVTGDVIIAASGIEGVSSSIFDLGLGGLLETILMLGGVFYEEEDEKSLNELLFDVIKFTLIVGAILSIVYFFTAPYIAPLYSKNQTIIEQATYSMRANSVAIIIFSLSTSLLTFLQASKRNLYAHISTTLQSLILPIIFMSSLGFTIGVKGIWIGFPLAFVFYFVIHLTYAFIKSKKIKVDYRTLFFAPKTFGYKDNQVYEKDINGINDVFSLESDVMNFCNKFKIDNKRKQNVSNAVEELGKLIVVSGFTKDNKKKPSASIKVLYKPNNKSLIIRSRDNCDKFDITEKIEEIKQGNKIDPALNSSIKVLIKLSKDIDYSRLFNTNNIIIKC